MDVSLYIKGKKRNRHVIALLFTLVFVASCERQAGTYSPKLYSKDSVSFSYPSNWTVSSDSIDDGVRVIHIETPGLKLSNDKCLQEGRSSYS